MADHDVAVVAVVAVPVACAPVPAKRVVAVVPCETDAAFHAITAGAPLALAVRLANLALGTAVDVNVARDAELALRCVDARIASGSVHLGCQRHVDGCILVIVPLVLVLLGKLVARSIIRLAATLAAPVRSRWRPLLGRLVTRSIIRLAATLAAPFRSRWRPLSGATQLKSVQSTSIVAGSALIIRLQGC